MVHVALSTISTTEKKEELNFETVPDQMIFTAEYRKEKMDAKGSDSEPVLQYIVS